MQLKKETERLRCATSLDNLGRSCLVHVNGLRLAPRHPPNNGTVPKLTPVQYASPSSSRGSRSTKKKVNFVSNRGAQHSRICEEASLRWLAGLLR